ncbi:MAG: LVIVD repeat-containing protein, partial [Nocardioidaceae bacterium]
HPSTAGDWAIGIDLGIDPADNPDLLGCFPATFDHSVRFVDDGMAIYGSYWDFGAVLLDISDPAAPVYRSRADIAPPDEDGDVHSVTQARGLRTLLVNPEDFSPLDCPGDPDFGGWGEVHLFDTADPAAPRHVGTFSTENSRSTRDDGIYSVHNTEAAPDRQAYSSWYSDGIVWWDFEDRRDPFLRGQWVPPAASDPTGTFPTIPIVWGVYLDRHRDLVLASDINSGLWIIRPMGGEL